MSGSDGSGGSGAGSAGDAVGGRPGCPGGSLIGAGEVPGWTEGSRSCSAPGVDPWPREDPAAPPQVARAGGCTPSSLSRPDPFGALGSGSRRAARAASCSAMARSRSGSKGFGVSLEDPPQATTLSAAIRMTLRAGTGSEVAWVLALCPQKTSALVRPPWGTCSCPGCPLRGRHRWSEQCLGRAWPAVIRERREH